ncbi:hypothetical protein P7C70_g8202, partial [Phenoliferia sp. Uapishka_3]
MVATETSLLSAAPPSASASPSTCTTRPSRRIVFFCDGSGLYRVIEKAAAKEDEIEQVLLWQPGVGMEKEDPWLEGLLARQLNFKIRRALEMIMTSYQPGDEVVLIGFSRGALICRILAAIIGDVGVPRRADLGELFEAYGTLPNCEPGGLRSDVPTPDVVAALSVLERHRSKLLNRVNIRALALFDTVGAIGMPSRTHLPGYRYFGFTLETVGPHVDLIVHALSLDDTANAFNPTRMELSPEGIADGQTLRFHQCWFGGWHADVGGGWEQHELADVALMWMAVRFFSLCWTPAGLLMNIHISLSQRSLTTFPSYQPSIRLDNAEDPSPTFESRRHGTLIRISPCASRAAKATMAEASGLARCAVLPATSPSGGFSKSKVLAMTRATLVT